jgi:hypothetical protein
LLFISVAPAVSAEIPEPSETEVWLVSYGPGEIYWQRFGHNAIWIRDRELGLDHAFNFGFFDFGQEDFLLRFLQGRMLYFSAAQPVRDEFAYYINENRDIRAQRLNLSTSQKLLLMEYLLEEVRPENRDYLYDYYLNNCSTRVRDSIDLALGGALKSESQPAPALQTWRDHTRRLTHQDFWLYLGLEVGLGAGVDTSISQWDEMFIPEKLAEAVAGMVVEHEGEVVPLVLEDVMLHESTLASPPVAPRAWWPLYLLASLGVVLAAWLFCRIVHRGFPLVLARSWLMLSGLAGLFLLFLWFGTDHAAVRPNLNLMILNPLWLLLAFMSQRGKLVAMVIVGMTLLALLQIVLPPHQYNLDVLAAFLPLNLTVAFVYYRESLRSAG